MKTRNQIQNEIDTKIVSNNSRAITAVELNGIFSDINDSTINQLSDASTFGLFEFNVSQTYQVNQCCVYNKKLYKANTQVLPGSFNPNQWVLQKDIKTFCAKLVGNLNDVPTMTVLKDDIFGSYPPFTFLGNGFYMFEYVNEVFGTSSVYSVRFDNTITNSNALAYAYATPVNETTNYVYFINNSMVPDDLITTYYTINVYN